MSPPRCLRHFLPMRCHCCCFAAVALPFAVFVVGSNSPASLAGVRAVPQEEHCVRPVTGRRVLGNRVSAARLTPLCPHRTSACLA